MVVDIQKFWRKTTRAPEVLRLLIIPSRVTVLFLPYSAVYNYRRSHPHKKETVCMSLLSGWNA
jgi:hypothetical protein